MKFLFSKEFITIFGLGYYAFAKNTLPMWCGQSTLHTKHNLKKTITPPTHKKTREALFTP
jgi:hypothetical protein